MQCPNCQANIPPSAGKTYCPFCRYSFKKNGAESIQNDAKKQNTDIPKPPTPPTPKKQPAGAMFAPKNDIFSQFEASISDPKPQTPEQQLSPAPNTAAQAQPAAPADTQQHQPTQAAPQTVPAYTPANKADDRANAQPTDTQANGRQEPPKYAGMEQSPQPSQYSRPEEDSGQPSSSYGSIEEPEPDHYDIPSDDEPDFVDDDPPALSKKEQREAERKLKKAVREQERKQKREKRGKDKKPAREKPGSAKKTVNDNGLTAEEAGYIAANRDGYYDPVKPIIEDQLPESPLLLIAKIAVIMIFVALIVVILVSVV